MHSKNLPLVSIIITSYNRGHYIGEAIGSALAQDYGNFEVIISDNASTDNTIEVIEKFQPDPRIQLYVNGSNIGMMPNFRRATELAKGEYITYISSDDYLTNNSFLSEAMNLITHGDNVVAVFAQNKTLNTFTDIYKAEMSGHLYKEKVRKGIDVFLQIPVTGSFGWGAALYNKALFNDVDPFSYKVISLDFLVNNFLMLQGNIGFVTTPSYVWRMHGNQASQKNTAAQIIENYDYFLKPYEFAKRKGIIPADVLEKWKNDILFHEARYISLRYLPVNRSQYDIIMKYFQQLHPVVYRKLTRNVKWNILNFFFSRPKFSLPFFRIFSKSHHKYLSQIISHARYMNS